MRRCSGRRLPVSASLFDTVAGASRRQHHERLLPAGRSYGPRRALATRHEKTRIALAQHPSKQDDFQRGWDAAILAARHWHEARAQQATVQSTRTRFPKNLEREAAVHRFCAEMMSTLSADDV